MLGVLAAVGTALRPLGTGIAGSNRSSSFACAPAVGRWAAALGLRSAQSHCSVPRHSRGDWPVAPVSDACRRMVRVRRRMPAAQSSRTGETIVLAGYSALPYCSYGLLLNLSFWPWALGLSSDLVCPGRTTCGEPATLDYIDLATSLGFDIPRAIITVVVILFVGKPVPFCAASSDLSRRLRCDCDLYGHNSGLGGGRRDVSQ